MFYYCMYYLNRKMDIERLKAMRNNLTPEYPFGGPKRQEVPEDKRLWSTQWAEYNPQVILDGEYTKLIGT